MLYPEMHPPIDPQAYDAAEAWSNEILQNHDVIFHPIRLEQAVKQKAIELDFPATVGPRKKPYSIGASTSL